MKFSARIIYSFVFVLALVLLASCGTSTKKKEDPEPADPKEAIYGKWEALGEPKGTIEYQKGGTVHEKFAAIPESEGKFKFISENIILVETKDPLMGKMQEKRKVEIVGDTLTSTTLVEEGEKPEPQKFKRVK